VQGITNKKKQTPFFLEGCLYLAIYSTSFLVCLNVSNFAQRLIITPSSSASMLLPHPVIIPEKSDCCFRRLCMYLIDIMYLWLIHCIRQRLLPTYEWIMLGTTGARKNVKPVDSGSEWFRRHRKDSSSQGRARCQDSLRASRFQLSTTRSSSHNWH
jgi:hypothetical protein